MIILAAYIVVKGLSLDESTVEKMFLAAQERAVRTYLPGVLLQAEDGETTAASWLMGKIEQQLPFSASEEENAAAMEDRETSSQIIAENSEFLQEKLLEENQGTETHEAGQKDEVEAAEQLEQTQSASAKSQERTPVTDIPLEKFQDFNYVLSNFYTVDK